MNKLGIGKKYIYFIMSVLFLGVVVGLLVMFRNQLFVRESVLVSAPPNISDPSFGWKFPVSEFQPITGRVKDLGAYSKLRDAAGLPRGLPVRLIIPEISVNTAIEDAQITSDGRMDVPQGSVNVAWFSLGPQPGQMGSAVIGGHYGKLNGVPFVFYELDKLRIGDQIFVVDDYGNKIEFIVRSIKLFDRNADASTVFVSDDGIAHLNLITCEGVWNKVNDTYPERRVVFADAVPSRVGVSSIATNISTTSAFAAFGINQSNKVSISIDEFVKYLSQNPTDALIIIFLLTFIVFVVVRLTGEKKLGVVKRKQ